MANFVPRLTTGDVGRGVRPQARVAATEPRDLSSRILQLQRSVGNRGVQPWLDSSTRRPTRRALQRVPADDEEFEPCPSWEWGSSFHFFGSRPGGPYQDQGIAIQYDKIAPLPDPVQAGDPRAQAEAFNTPAMLEQLYHDATVPLGVPESQPQKRRRALWFVCIIEDSASRVGVREARELYKIGCLTVLNCGMDWGRVFAHFSETTASGR
jgi:hypothetical protein